MSDTTKIELARIKYWVNWLSQSFATGKWDSYFQGRGFNFQGIVPYRDDPDLVRINWPATLISDEVQVSTFSEEHNTRICLLGDLGPWVAFGSTQTKLYRLALITALISFSAYRNKDYFRFFGNSDEEELGFPEPGDRKYSIQLAEAILNFDWRGKKRGGLIRAARRVSSQKSLVVSVSDYLGKLADTQEALKILSDKHDILPIILWDKRETKLPEGFGVLPLRDLETGKRNYLLLSDKSRRAVAQNAKEDRKTLEEMFLRYGTRPFFFTEESPDLEELVRMFLSRRARL